MTTPRFLFLHNVKTAGKTIEKFMLRKFQDQFCKTTLIFTEETVNNIFSILDSNDKEKWSRLNSAKALSGHFSYGLHRMLEGESKYFTLLRDPVARVRSYYAYSLKNEGSKIYKYLHDNNISFEQFVEMDHDDIKKADVHELNYVLEDGQAKVIAGKDIKVGEHYEAADLLKIVEDNIKKDFAFVGVTEMFDDSFIEISKLLGLSRFSPYITYNRSTVKVDISDTARKVILKRNIVDTELHSRYLTQISEISDSMEHIVARSYLKLAKNAANIYVALRS
jgi:hypothetical protein